MSKHMIHIEGSSLDFAMHLIDSGVADAHASNGKITVLSNGSWFRNSARRSTIVMHVDEPLPGMALDIVRTAHAVRAAFRHGKMSFDRFCRTHLADPDGRIPGGYVFRPWSGLRNHVLGVPA